MTATRFDAWTRRRFGGAAAGAMASWLGTTDARAKPGKNKKRKSRKKTCEALGTPCNPRTKQRTCCAALHCLMIPALGHHRCCRPLFEPCTDDGECCPNLVCTGPPGSNRFCETAAR